MASWTPSVTDVTGHVSAWAHAADEVDIVGHIADAVTEVRGEVGRRFDPTLPINPDDPPDDQITLGDLAHQAAEYRAADLWIAGLSPEQPEVVGELRRELYAQYQRALTRLLRHSSAAARNGRQRRAVAMTPWVTP
jgi:hypothetical protein